MKLFLQQKSRTPGFLIGLFLLFLGFTTTYATTNTGLKTPPKGTILVVLSSTDSILLKDGRDFPAGYFLNELFIPVHALIKAGYTIEIATPKGEARLWMNTLIQLNGLREIKLNSIKP